MLTSEEKQEIKNQINELKQKSDSFRENNLQKKKKHNVILQYAHLGIEFIGIFLVFLFAGKFADDKFHTSPLFILLGVVIGFTLAMFRIVQVAKKLEKEFNENTRE